MSKKKATLPLLDDEEMLEAGAGVDVSKFVPEDRRQDAEPISVVSYFATVSIQVSEKCFPYIGGVAYEFYPGKVYKVPENVKEVLRARGVLSVI